MRGILLGSEVFAAHSRGDILHVGGVSQPFLCVFLFLDFGIFEEGPTIEVLLGAQKNVYSPESAQIGRKYSVRPDPGILLAAQIIFPGGKKVFFETLSPARSPSASPAMTAGGHPCTPNGAKYGNCQKLLKVPVLANGDFKCCRRNLKTQNPGEREF